MNSTSKPTQSSIKKRRLWPLIGLALIGLAVLTSVINRLRRGPVSPHPSPSAVVSPSPRPTLSPLVLATPSLEPSPNQTGYRTLLSHPLLSPHLNAASQTIAGLNPDTNQLISYSLASESSTDLQEGSSFIDQIAWSSDQRKVVLRLTNGQGNRVENPFFRAESPYGAPLTLAYELWTGSIKNLDSHINSVAFVGPNQIIYQYRDEQQNNLALALADGSSWRNIDRLAGKAELIAAGSSVLVASEANPHLVRRYDNRGRITETIRTPSDLTLSQSSWAPTGQRAIYWTTAQGEGDQEVQTVIKYFADGQDRELTRVTQAPDQTTILWDNTTNRIYLASSNGLIELTVSAPSL